MTDQIQSSAIAGLLETLDADGRFFNGMSLPIAGANEILRLASRIAELEACRGCAVQQGYKPAEALQGIGEPATLTDEQIDAAFERMPDGVQGFLKSWGYRQFAREIVELAALKAAPAVQAVEPVAIAEITSASHDAAEFGERGLCLLADFQHLEYGTKLYAQPVERTPLSADEIKEPKNGEAWRVEWWNESLRMMLPSGKVLHRFTAYRNGTLQFTLKARAHHITQEKQI